MSKFKIEKPADLKTQGSSHKKKSVFISLLISLCLILLTLALVFISLQLLRRPQLSRLHSLEIENFNGNVELLRPRSSAWQKAERGMPFAPGSKMRTAKDSEAEIMIPGVIKIRLKPETEIQYKTPGLTEGKADMYIHVAQGELLAATENRERNESEPPVQLLFSAPEFKARAEQGYFFVKAAREGNSLFGVMRGRAEVSKTGWISPEWEPVASLHYIGTSPKGLEKPRSIGREEWNQMREVYELTIKTAAMEALQLDLSKKAGVFFGFVFDHGTFYTPKFGYCGREFFLDESLGEAYFEIEYDVFPKGSFVGMYVKSRGLDLAKYSALELEIRKSPGEEGEPKSIRLELKSKNGLVRAFALKLPKREWQKVSFPLYVRDSTLLTEMTFVFLHDRVGEFKKGTVQMRRIDFIPLAVSPAPLMPLAPQSDVASEIKNQMPKAVEKEIKVTVEHETTEVISSAPETVEVETSVQPSV